MREPVRAGEFNMHKFCTPWGAAHVVKPLDWGGKVLEVHTASHGGIAVMADVVLPAWAIACAEISQDGTRFFEEDVCWSAAATALPKFFSSEALQSAEHTLRHWLPKTYMEAFGVQLAVDASQYLTQLAFEEETKDKYVVTAGFGDWAYNVPTGMVYACGWRRADESTKGFLVPEVDYVNPSRLVLDGYQEWEPDRTQPYVNAFKANAAPRGASARH
jgi:hypothetical protein